MKKQQSVVWEGPETIKLINRDIPEVVPGSILVKVHSCAICGSDLRIYKEGNNRIKAPQVIGHEIAGEVVAVGEGVNKFQVGDRISSGADVPCGECIHCKNGRSNCCDINYAIGYQFEGGFSEYILFNPLVVEHGPLKVFREEVDYDIAALAEPLACCINGYEIALMEKGKSVVIFGAGPIGVMLAELGKLYEASSITVIDIADSRLEMAKNIGQYHIINSAKEDVTKAVMQITDDLGADRVFTACPSIEAHKQALDIIAKRGVINFFGGLPKSEPALSILSNLIHYKEIYLTGSHGSTPKQHAQAVQWIEEGKIDIGKLITHRYELNDIDKAFDVARSGKALKVMVKPNV